MSKQEIFSTIQTVVAEQLGKEEDSVIPEANIANDLGADYLDIAELILVLEDTFNIEIPDEESNKIATVQQIVDYISQKKYLLEIC